MDVDKEVCEENVILSQKQSSKTVAKALIFYLLLSGLISGIVISFSPTSSTDFNEMKTLSFVGNIFAVMIATYVIVRHYGKDCIPISFHSSKLCKRSTLVRYVMIAIGFSAGVDVVITLLDYLFQQYGITLLTPDFTIQKDMVYNIVLLINVVIIAPIFEEWLFRGLLLNTLRKHGDGFAIIITSILFGMIHGNFIQGISAAFSSIALCYFVIKTGSLRISIFIHFLNNFVTMCFSYQDVSETITIIATIIQLLLFIYAIYMLLKNKTYIGNVLRCKLSDIQKFFLGNWIMLIFLLIIILSFFTSIYSI